MHRTFDEVIDDGSFHGDAGSSGVRRAVAVLAGARDQFQLPLALHERGMLEALVTELYWPADRVWFDRTMGRWVPRSLIEARYREGLDSDKVRVSKRALAAYALMKIGRSTRLNPYKSASLGRAALDLALERQAALFAYSTYAVPAFGDSGARPPFRFLFQMHPHPAAARAILQEEMELVPSARASLAREYEFLLPEREYDLLCQEPELANGWVAASSYTARTLSENGIPRDRIHIVPYGVDPTAFPQRTGAPSTREAFKIVFLGSVIQRKGLSYLLDAVRLLGNARVRVVLCGRGVIDRDLLALYSDLPLEIRVGLPRKELVQEIHSSDIVALPSLTEGFAHAILEALACGVPVLTTSNTCAPDVMCDGEHGFIVPIRSAAAIAERLSWAIDNREELAGMGEAAGRRARTFTWERFRSGIRTAYARMLSDA